MLSLNNTPLLNEEAESWSGWPVDVRSNTYVITALGVCLSLVLYEVWFRNSYGCKMLRNMPTPPRLPLIGNAHLFLGLSNSEIMKKVLGYLEQYGETTCARLGNMMFVFLTNPADIEIILNSQQHLEKSDEYGFFKPWFGDGLLISKGAHWRHHRKMIAPTFHQSILKSFVPTFVKYSQRVAAKLGSYVDGEIDVHDYMSQTTVEILLSTAMGMKKLPDEDQCSGYAKAVVDMCDIIHKRQTKLYYRLNSIYNLTKLREKGDRMMNTILGMTKKVVNDRKLNFHVETSGVIEEIDDSPKQQAQPKKASGLRDDLDENDENDIGAKRRLALLDAMVDMTKNPEIEWTEKDIMDEVNTIMFEGHDTTSAGSSFVLCLLGIHKDVQAKVYAEQKDIFGQDMLRDCTFADTMEMKYLERVIMETLRLYPPVPIIARKTHEEVRLASGPYTIPKGITVALSQFAVHRRADIYPNPEKFDPDNFLPEKVSKRHYYSFIPFSAGPRSCVGRKFAMLMLKVLLSTLLRKFEVHSDCQEKDFQLQGDIILKLANGFKVVLKNRRA